jgi:hypothetical protein
VKRSGRDPKNGRSPITARADIFGKFCLMFFPFFRVVIHSQNPDPGHQC